MVNEKETSIGLSSTEAEKRLLKYGRNRIEKKENMSWVKIFLSQFNDFIIWVLIAATIISGLMGDKADAITILIIVIMNAMLGFIQEFKTEKSLEALKELTAPTAKVKRDGVIKVLNAETLVIGDVLLLESGDRIPADAIIMEDRSFILNESLLTGESLGVEKTSHGKNNNAYMGTIVLTGRATAKVISTGMDTEMGKIASMLQSIEKEKSPLKEKLGVLGKVITYLCIGICVIVTVTGVMRGENIYAMFLLGVSLAVAAIPEGLPAIVTVALALGVSRMLKRNALVRKLPAVETLGCTSIICSDKTGTLTENNMTVKEFYSNGRHYNIEKEGIPENITLKKVFTYCNDCNFDEGEKDFKKSLIGDPTETALIKAYFKSALDLKSFLSKTIKLYDNPFDSDRKMMSVIIKENYKDTCYVKGAPEQILKKCKFILDHGIIKILSENEKEKILKSVEFMSLRALRCIGAAYKENGIVKNKTIENDLIFVGVAGIIDPPRKEVKGAVLNCKRAGIKTVMITGDHKNTAFAIAKELDICKNTDEVITGDEIDRLSDKEFEKKIDTCTVFARVNPYHKLRIVKGFKSKNKIVAMTGDGVNDAPAVKEADIGIAMGISGTDVTKEASAMILLDDNFTTIVSAVEEGRIIYNNIRKFIRYLLSCNLGEVLTMFLASIFGLQTPLLSIQILFVNLATDGLPAIALGIDPSDDDVMIESPREKNESLFARGLKEKIAIRGVLIGVCTVLSFIAGKYYMMNLQTCRTLALCTLILSQLIHVFECRSEKKSLFEINIFANLYLVGAVLISILMLISILYIKALQVVFHTVALNLGQWLIVIFFSGIIAFINSLYIFARKR